MSGRFVALLLAAFMVLPVTSVSARTIPKDIDLPPFVDDSDPVVTPPRPPAPVEIIDGGDVDTLKALYPGMCKDDCPGLRRMREQRLAHEARCVVSDTHEFIDFVHMSSYANVDLALESIEKAKSDFVACRNKMPKEASQVNWVNESVDSRSVAGSTVFSATVAANVRVPKESVSTELLAGHEECKAIRVINLREETSCP